MSKKHGVQWFSLYSPVLPMETGTADYFEHLLETLQRRGIPADRVRIVVDDDHWKPSQKRSHVCGFPVCDYRTVPDVVDTGETRVFFVANNELHGYVHRSLTRAQKVGEGRIISIVHDVSCMMLLKHLSFNGLYSFSPQLFTEMNRAQLGGHAGKVIDDRQAGNLSQGVEFVVHSQGATLAASDEIWTHSRFGALKLILESDLPFERMPTFRCVRHPAYDDGTSSVARASELEPTEAKQPGVFRLGIFGWVNPSKRIYESLRALRLMLARLGVEDRSRVEMVIVGKLPPTFVYDPVGYAKELGVEANCRFFGFVDTAKFRALINDCDCVLNLRFPSCGESSGAAAHARGSGADLLMSACQAFNEESATAHIDPLPAIEEFVLASEMTRLFTRWRTGERGANEAGEDQCGTLAAADELLAAEMWTTIIGDGQDARAGGARISFPKEFPGPKTDEFGQEFRRSF